MGGLAGATVRSGAPAPPASEEMARGGGVASEPSVSGAPDRSVESSGSGGSVKGKRGRPPTGFDRVAYQRDLMRRRAASRKRGQAVVDE